MLARRLVQDGRILVLAPPALLDKDNPGSWPNVFFDFQVPAQFVSIGQMEKVIDQGADRYKTVFIDEAHRFRSDDTMTYANLQRICYGKQVVVVTATPYNNRPSDILSQIKLFQRAHDSTIPNLRDLQRYFSRLETRAKQYDRRTDYENYVRVMKENAKRVREDVLRHLMVRRTRTEVQAYFRDDIERQGLRFPEVGAPVPLLYELDAREDAAFDETRVKFASLKYARYTPLLYLLEPVTAQQRVAQVNLMGFMRALFVKRLDSSFTAFRSTLARSIASSRKFIEVLEAGAVYVSEKHLPRIFEAFDQDDDEAIERLLDAGKAEKYPAEAFDTKLLEHARADLQTTEELAAIWDTIDTDPKIDTFLKELAERSELRDGKVIVFTEAAVTAKYLKERLETDAGRSVLLFTGAHGAADRRRVIQNFDANAPRPHDDFNILVTTEVLSEGVNLHRSNVIVNYDIPWNPTRMMQRVGRVNRVGTVFDKVHTFNFFPTTQVNQAIGLKEAAEAKIESFFEMLGADARLLTEGETPEPKGLFEMLTSKEMLEDEADAEESELKYLEIIRAVRDDDPALFARIRDMPKKARSARQWDSGETSSVLTFFRKGALIKFLRGDAKGAHELDFMAAAKVLEATPETELHKMTADDLQIFYDRFDNNKAGFDMISGITDQEDEGGAGGRATNLRKIANFVKAIRKDDRLTDIDITFLDDLRWSLDAGVIPRNMARNVVRDLEGASSDTLDLLGILRGGVDPAFLQRRGREVDDGAVREVILSEFLKTE